MTSLLKNSELSIEKADKIVSETLNSCDDGELYVEDTKSETIVLDDNKIKSSNYTSDLGYGFRAVTGDTVAYSHSNEISEKSLKNSSDNLKSTLKNNSGTYNSEIKKTNQKLYKDIDPIESKSMKSKIDVLAAMPGIIYMCMTVVFLIAISMYVFFCKFAPSMASLWKR